jgi:tRNA(fMet)-specific endonuclease VapC
MDARSKVLPTSFAKIEKILDEMGVLPLGVPADSDDGALRTALEVAGQPIGGSDIFIAAHARCSRPTLVTANVREVSRVRGLSLENWMV